MATLFVSSNASDTDFVAKLVDVFSNGTRMLVADGQRVLPMTGFPALNCMHSMHSIAQAWLTDWLQDPPGCSFGTVLGSCGLLFNFGLAILAIFRCDMQQAVFWG